MLRHKPQLRALFVVGLLGATLALVRSGVSEGQGRLGGDPLTEETRDPRVIAGQLRAGMELTQLALIQLRRPDALETFETSYSLTSRAYAQVRVAIANLYFARRSAKFKDPTLDLQIKYTNVAWKHIRLVVDSHGASTHLYVKAHQIPRDIEHLDQAARILNQVTSMMP
jgi:hypothetical protein